MTRFAESAANDLRSENDTVLMPDAHTLIAANIPFHAFAIARRARSIHLQILLVDLDPLGALAVPALNFLEILLAITGFADVPDEAHFSDEVEFASSLAIRARILESLGLGRDVETPILMQLLNQDCLLQPQLPFDELRDLVLLAVVKRTVEQDAEGSVNLVDVQRAFGNLDPLTAFGDVVEVPYRERGKVAITNYLFLVDRDVHLLLLHTRLPFSFGVFVDKK